MRKHWRRRTALDPSFERRSTQFFWLVVVLSCAWAHLALASIQEANGWRIEKWSDEKALQFPGKSIRCHILLQRTGPAIQGVYLVDLCPTGKSSFSDITLPPQEGGLGQSYARWNLGVMKPGDVFAVAYTVTASGAAADMGLASTTSAYDAESNWLISVGYWVGPSYGLSTTSAANAPNSPQTSDPINAINGEFYYEPPPDLDLGGPLPVRFSRYYSSAMPVTTRFWLERSSKTSWVHNYDRSVSVSTSPAMLGSLTTALVVHRNGQVLRFVAATNNPSRFALNFHQEPIPYQLQQDPAGHYWFLDPQEERVYRFDPGGRLAEILDRNHNQLTITMDEATNRVLEVKDGLGRQLTFEYSDGLANVSDGTRRVHFSRDANSRLRAFTNVLGQTTLYQGTSVVPAQLTRLAAIVNPLGNSHYTQAYNTGGTLGTVTRQTDAYAHATSIGLNEPSRGFTTVTNADGSRTVFAHDQDRLSLAVTDPAGQTVTNRYSDRDQPIGVQDRLGQNTQLAWNPSGDLAAITNANGDVIRLQYAPRTQIFTNHSTLTNTIAFVFQDLARIDYPDGSFEQFDSDECGNVIRRLDRTGGEWLITYNEHGQVLSIANPVGGTRSFQYNSNAMLIAATDPETGTTRFGYDTLFRLAAITNADGSVRRFGLDPMDRLTNYVDELGLETRFEYDANGNLARAIDPAGQSVRYAYDLMDRLTNLTSRAGALWTLSYDDRERLSAVIDPSGRMLTREFDVCGRLTNIVYAGQNWRADYTAEGILQAQYSPLGHATYYAIDPLGRTRAITNALGQVTSLARDSQGRILAVTNPLGQVTQYRYNQAGALTNVTLPNGSGTYYQRNRAGQIEQITDLNGELWRFSYSSLGRLQTATDPNDRTWHCAYDNRGRVFQVTTPDGGIVTNTYDAASQLVRRDYSDSTHLECAYDRLGRLANANGVALQYNEEGYLTNSLQDGIAFSARYDAQGRPVELAYNNGALRIFYNYDPVSGRLLGVSDTLGNGSVQFAYDAGLRLTSLNRGNGKNLTLTWDAAGQLIRFQDGGLVDLQNQFDAAGRLVKLDYSLPLDPSDHLSAADETAVFDNASQIQSAGYACDALGRVIQGRGITFRWDAASRLAAIDEINFTHNGLGNLVARTANGQTTRFFYHHGIVRTPLAAERDETTGHILRYYVWSPGGSLLYYIDVQAGNRVCYYHFDDHGSTVALTDPDGAITDAYAYDPYGRLLQHSGASSQPFTFVGRYGVRQEGTNGLYHMRARYYDAVTARFLSRDPIWPWLDDVRQLNPYQYAANDPIMSIDPLGEAVYNDIWKWDVWDKEYSSVNLCNLPRCYLATCANNSPDDSWTEISPTGHLPTARTLYEAAVYGTSYWVFGGPAGGAGDLMSDWSFNVRLQKWIQPNPASAPGDSTWIRELLNGTTMVESPSSLLHQDSPIENHMGKTEAARKFRSAPSFHVLEFTPRDHIPHNEEGIGSRYFNISNADN